VLTLAPARLAQPPATTPGARTRGAQEQGIARATANGGPGAPLRRGAERTPMPAMQFPQKPSANSPEIHGARGVSLTV
jgi:hypothetical protein